MIHDGFRTGWRKPIPFFFWAGICGQEGPPTHVGDYSLVRPASRAPQRYHAALDEPRGITTGDDLQRTEMKDQGRPAPIRPTGSCSAEPLQKKQPALGGL
jgi:hypothetical protein